VALLKVNGHETWGFASAKQVRKEVLDGMDTAVIDIHLPDSLGTELARQLKQDYSSLKIILMTGYPVEVEMLTPGTTVFGKPLVLKRLLKVL
jgi:FixJ family two-component response regulator